MKRKSDTNKLCDLFFELSHTDRMRILLDIKQKSRRLTELSQRLKLKRQEVSRHITRLNEAQLVEKDFGGFYHLTPIGKLALHVVPSFNFFLKHSDYFLRHDLSTIPPELLSRISEMENSVHVKELMKVVRLIELCIKRAEQQIRIMYDQILLSAVPIIEERVQKGARFACLFPENYIPPPGFKPVRHGNIDKRSLKEVKNYVLLTEKEAVVAFTDLSGAIDYTGVFHAQDGTSRKWCEDLLNHFWQKGEPQPLYLPKEQPDTLT